MTVAQEPSTYTVPVPGDKAGTRLDRLLAEALPHLSRTRLKALIQARRVVRGGDGTAVTDPAYRAASGEVFTVAEPPPAPAEHPAQAMPLDVVFEDRHLIVVDKPAGLVVHPAPGNPDRTLVNALLAHCGDLSGVGGSGRPGIVHRLDKDTSGLMVAAKTDAAHRGLAEQFAERRVERAYTAVAWGVPVPAAGEIAGAIGRNPANRKKMAVVGRGGKPALTRYRVVRPLGAAASVVDCRLATGRTHQIRVHLASRGHPVVGDPLYGGRRREPRLTAAAAAAVAGLDRLALHAYLIGFIHPENGKSLRFESDLPIDIKQLIFILE